MTNPFPHAQSSTRIVLDLEHLLALVDQVRARVIPALEELVDKLEIAGASELEMDFGGLIKAAQFLLELDDADLARTLNVSRPTIGRWIRGTSSPHPLSRRAICEALVKKARGRTRLLQG